MRNDQKRTDAMLVTAEYCTHCVAFLQNDTAQDNCCSKFKMHEVHSKIEMRKKKQIAIITGIGCILPLFTVKKKKKQRISKGWNEEEEEAMGRG